MRLITFLLFGCQPETDLTDDQAWEHGCQHGTLCGMFEGEDEGSQCQEIPGRAECSWYLACSKTDIQPSGCAAQEFEGFGDCYDLAYDEAFVEAGAEAGCPTE